MVHSARKPRSAGGLSRLPIGLAILSSLVALPLFGYTRIQGKADIGSQSFVTNISGVSAKATRVCPGALVTLYESGTTTLPPTYSTSSGIAKSNPTTADSNGEWYFYVDDGSYDYRVDGCGVQRTIREIVVGSVNGIGSDGVIDVASYATRGDGAVEVVTGTGSLAVTNGSATVNGAGTAFLSQLAIGDILKVAGNDDLVVKSIADDDTLVLHKVYPGSTSAQSFTFRRPWSGSYAAMPKASDKAYYYRAGVFADPQVNMRGYTRYRLFGAGPGATQIIGTGSGAVLNLGADAPTTFQAVVENMQIRSTGSATNGIEAESTHHSVFRSLKIRDVTNSCFYLDFGVQDHIEDLRCTQLDGDWSVTPLYGLWISCLDPANVSSTLTVIDGATHIGGPTVAGVLLGKVQGANFTNTTIEGGPGRGMWVTSDASRTTLDGVHLEANTGTDLELDATNAMLLNVFVDGNVEVDGNRNTIIGGWINILHLNGNYNTVRDVLYNLLAGGVTDTGAGNFRDNIAPATTQVPDISRRNNDWISRTVNGDVGLINDPGYTEFAHIRLKQITTTPLSLSDTTYATGVPWRIIFDGYFQNNNIGPGLAMQPVRREVTSTSPSFAVGGMMLTVTQTGGGLMQIAVTAGGTNAGYAGTMLIVSGKYATGFDSRSAVYTGLIQSAGGQWDPIAFASLGTPTNGTFRFCSDCTVANPCAGGGTGALAKRLNGVWVCN